MAAVALLTVLTGASEESGGVIVHVEMGYVEHPVPEGLDSWDDVIPSAATGPRYYWGPTGTVVVQRTDGSFVEATNDLDHAVYQSRVSVLESRSGEWFITAVERRDDEPVLVAQEGLPEDQPLEAFMGGQEAVVDSLEATEVVGAEREDVEGDGDVAEKHDILNPAYEGLVQQP